MKFCKYCGAKLKPGQKVCGKCHRKVEDTKTSPNDKEKELRQEIAELENQLEEEEKNKDINIIHRLAITNKHLQQVFQFIVHNLLTTIVLILIAIIFTKIRWYALVLIILLTYAYPLLSSSSYYPWEKWLRKFSITHKKEKSKGKKDEQERSHPQSTNKDKVIVISLVVIIAILVSLIIFFVTSTKSTSSVHSHTRTAAVKRSSSKKESSVKKKRSTATTQQRPQQKGQQLSPSNMDDKLKAAAAYYYASEHHQKMFEFETAVRQNGLSLSRDVSAEYQEGSDPVSIMPLNTGAGAIPFYTTDGDTVYFYVPSALLPEVIGKDSDDSDQPVLTASWQEICDLVNQNDAYDQVKKVADNSKYTGE